MSDQTELNNWFTGELVAVADMKPVNSLIMSNVFSSMPVGSVLGIVPTIDIGMMTFATTAGYAFFGVTADSGYITNTGSTTLACTIEAQGALTLVDVNSYIYIQPIITTITSNRYTVVTGEVYSSTNASDVGIKICDVVAGVAVNYNNNSIKDYFNINGGLITVQSPDGTPINIELNGEFVSNYTAAGIIEQLNNNSTTGWDMTSTEVATNNYANVGTNINTAGHVSTALLSAGVNSIEQYRLRVRGNSRPDIVTGGSGSVFGIPGASDIVVGANLNPENLLAANGFQRFPGYITLDNIILQWGNFNFTGASPTVNVTFPKPFPTTGLFAMVGGVAAGTNGINTLYWAGLISNTGASFFSQGVASPTYSHLGSWIAVGY